MTKDKKIRAMKKQKRQNHTKKERETQAYFPQVIPMNSCLQFSC